MRPGDPGICGQQIATELPGKGDVAGIVCRKVVAQIPDSFQENNSGMSDNAQPPQGIENRPSGSSVQFGRVQSAGIQAAGIQAARIQAAQIQSGTAHEAANPAGDFGIDQMRRMQGLSRKGLPRRPVVQQGSERGRGVDNDHASRPSSTSSTINPLGTPKSGKEPSSSALPALPDASANSRTTNRRQGTQDALGTTAGCARGQVVACCP